MKKIPTVFERVFENNKIIGITGCIPKELQRALYHGDATVKADGACCAIIDGILYKRFDLKPGRTLPENAIPCQESADPITGHFPHWVKCNRENPADKWFFEAYDHSFSYGRGFPADATYEAIGKHFNGNPYKMDFDMLVRHGWHICENVVRSFEGVMSYLSDSNIEGLVFWYDGKPVCKIKRTDFGFDWPCKDEDMEW